MSTIHAARGHAAAHAVGDRGRAPYDSQSYASVNNANEALARMYRAVEMYEVHGGMRRTSRSLDMVAGGRQALSSHTDVYDGNGQWAGQREKAEKAQTEAYQQHPAANTTREPSPSPYTIQEYGSANISDEELALAYRRREGMQMACRATFHLCQILRSAPAGGYSPPTFHVPAPTRREGPLKTHQIPTQTTNNSQSYSDNGWAKQGGNGVGPTKQSNGSGPMTMGSGMSSFSERAARADLGQEASNPRSDSASMPPPNTTSPLHVQRKRKRYIQRNNTREYLIGMRR